MTTNGKIEDLVRQFMRMPETHNLACDPSRRLQRPIDNPEIAEPAQTLLDLGLAVKALHYLFEDHHRWDGDFSRPITHGHPRAGPLICDRCHSLKQKWSLY